LRRWLSEKKQPAELPAPAVYTIPEVAALLKKSRRTIYRMIDEKQLVAVCARIPKWSLDRLLSGQGRGEQ
jgi:excisionase family DNA binding protein